jgi:tellurite resistance protein TerC
MDNVFVMALIFAYFQVPDKYQHRVLFWGIMGALIMRGVMIGAGAALIAKFHWVLYLLGAFLVYSGAKIIFTEDEGVHPDKNPVLKLARKFYPVSEGFEGQKFFTTMNGRRALTPLALVLLMVETTDLVFAIDSIPAIFAVTTKPFIIFTSNVFAILNLRSLYFLLSGAIRYFRYLKVGLSLVLMFIGVKMVLPFLQKELGILESLEIEVTTSLMIVAGILFVSVVFSVFAAGREGRLFKAKGKDRE